MSIRNKEYLELLKHVFDESKFIDFIVDLLNLDSSNLNRDISKISNLSKQHENNIQYYKFVANYNDGMNNIGVFIIKLNNTTSTNARSKQRNFVATLLSKYNLDASLVAFYSDKETSWRLSFVKKELSFSDKGIKEELTPAKRYSYLVGENESVHTAQEFLLKLLDIDDRKITLADIEKQFDIEKVTKKFFEEYKEKYLELKEFLDRNEDFQTEAKNCDFDSAEFAKKLMGQIVFLYFLQKKGWLGVQLIPDELSIEEYNELLSKNDSISQNLIEKYFKNDNDKYIVKKISGLQEDIINLTNIFKGTEYDKPWGTGKKDFIKSIFNQAQKENINFFDDYLEYFFYKGLNEKRENQYFPLFNCKIPFLNGGLFEPLNNYRWSSANFEITNSLFSNDDKTGILDFLDLYNFTIDEEEPLEKEIAVDPEMLGKIFENLLDIDDRKSKGAFYTPREIVHYMCQESLANYLVNKVNTNYDETIQFIKYGDLISQHDREQSISDSKDFIIGKTLSENLINIDDALINVKIADPAVGSGAFSLGMLNEIIKLRTSIQTYILIKQKLGLINIQELYNTNHLETDIYKMKLQTIENSIYAVDTEPSAVDITKLRLWLSLIVDYPNNQEPQPLPNLDYKIMQGNSLLDEYEGIQLFSDKILNNFLKNYKRNLDTRNIKEIKIQFNLLDKQVDIAQQMKQLIAYQTELFKTSDSKKKKELKKHIEDIQLDIIRYSIDDSKKISEITDLMKKRQKPWFIWKMEFFDVFKEKGGFDIVIGNPPYGAELSEVEKKIFLKKYNYVADYETANYFVSFGKELLNNNGILTYIIPNMFMANVNAKKFRNYLLNNWKISRIDNFSEFSIFESANVRNCIVLLQNSIAKKTDYSLFTKMCYNGILNVDKFKTFDLNSLFEKIDNWLNILDENEEITKIIEKIKFSSTQLINYCDISQGLIPYDKYRGHTNEQIKNKVWNSNFKKDKTYKKELKGQDVKRYSLKWNGNDWISYGPWLAAPRKQDFFTAKRILIREITNPRIFATITCEEYYNTPSIINCINFKIDINYVLGILNSKLMSFYHIKSSPKSNKGMFPKILVADVKKIPIKVGTQDEIKKISLLVKKNLQNYNEQNDNEIDEIVYKIYGITFDDKIIIDKEFN
mgnify:FL=1